MDQNSLGPAEKLVQSLTPYTGHVYHGRPGLLYKDSSWEVGVRWEPAVVRKEGEQRVVYLQVKQGKKSTRVRVGVLGDDYKVRDNTNGREIAEFRNPGVLAEIASWIYRKIAEVWKLDNEFAARWASWGFAQDQKDMKSILAAFMLVQSRRGDPILNEGKVAFYDDDYRDVGEAMLLLQRKDGRELRPKDLIRVYEFLSLPEIVMINRELGFTTSTRNPQYGRWYKVVTKWLRYREQNPKVLEGLVKNGMRTTVMKLVRLSGYKPETPRFFEILRWKQVQSKDGRRTIAIGQQWAKAQDWSSLSEEGVCEKIVKERPAWKVITSMLPNGVTPAIMAAAIESNCLSKKDLIIVTPTLEELGLLNDDDSATKTVRERWAKAVREADDMRAANIANNVRSKEVAQKLHDGAEAALQKAVEKVMRGLRVYFFVDVSGSMQNSIIEAKQLIEKFLHGFPPEQLHVAVFNTFGKELIIPHRSTAGVNNAFKGITAGGGTDYGAGVRALQSHKPGPNEDAIFFFVGDEEAHQFTESVLASEIKPTAFFFLKVRNPGFQWTAVRTTAAHLGIPCVIVDEHMFDDPYAIPQILPTIIASAPVGTAVAIQRSGLIDEILKTELLKKPAWAA
jgi:hypothetical protein